MVEMMVLHSWSVWVVLLFQFARWSVGDKLNRNSV